MEKFLTEAKQFCKSEKGSALLEASFLYPAILIVTVSMVLFTIVVYQQSLVHYQARRAADKLAYVWNYNSDAQKVDNGQFVHYTSESDGGDGLYWRLHGNNILQQVGINFNKSGGVVAKKTQFANDKYKKSNVTIEVEFENKLLSRNQVKVTATSGFKMPSFLKNAFGIKRDFTAVAYADVVDTVENMRDLKFIAYVTGEIKQKLDQNGMFSKVLGFLGF